MWFQVLVKIFVTERQCHTESPLLLLCDTCFTEIARITIFFPKN